MEVYRGGPLDLDGTLIWQLDQARIAMNKEEVLSAGGQTDVVFAGNIGVGPVGSFTTPAIAALLGEIPFNGAAITLAKLWNSKLVHGGSVAAGGVHIPVEMHQVHGLIRRIQAQRGQRATAEFDLIATYDLTNQPVKKGAAAALPAFAGAGLEFTVGPAEIGAVASEVRIELQSAELSVNARDAQFGHSGVPYPELSAVLRRETKVTLRTLDIDQLSDARLIGSAETNLVFYLRALENRGTVVADATASHIKFTCAATKIDIQENAQSDGRESEAVIEATLVDDGTNDYITVATGVAISLAS